MGRPKEEMGSKRPPEDSSKLGPKPQYVVNQLSWPDTTATAEHFIYVTQVYFCGTYAVVIWDWIISLPREYRFVWRTHWTPVKIAYLFCRYWVITVVPYLLYCFVVDHSLATCQKIYRVAVLLIRTYAFFNRNTYILLFLLSALSGVIAYQLYVDTTQMLLLPFARPPSSKPHSAHLLGFFVRTINLHAQKMLILLQIAPLLFDTVVTAMTVWKAFTIRIRNGGPNSRLIQTFLREGVFYYILISIANLINGIFYLQPRQVISAINIPLSVMMGPVLACRLILDLRERGSETVSHSEGTGIAAFTTKSLTQQQCSPFTPPAHRKSATGGYGRHTRGMNTASSNIMLSTLGSIHPDMDLDIEQDVADLEAIHLGMGMDLGSLSTAMGGDDGEPIAEGDSHGGSPAPAYHALEIGFRGGLTRPSMDDCDVEKSTSTI
ncbi:hypothetical protein FPV67DRAFT_1466873 [Lyophyllum atratum]|nr:hypothetical protein FPV67DRAFT_1466873 [Lyophyllum atratum]